MEKILLRLDCCHITVWRENSLLLLDCCNIAVTLESTLLQLYCLHITVSTEKLVTGTLLSHYDIDRLLLLACSQNSVSREEFLTVRLLLQTVLIENCLFEILKVCS